MGFRVLERLGLRHQYGDFESARYVRRTGKERCTRLTAQAVAVLKVWLRGCPGTPTDRISPSRPGGRLSSDAIQRLVSVQLASHRCPSLRSKLVNPHLLRHSAAIKVLHSGVDTTVTALWLSHEGAQRPRSTSTRIVRSTSGHSLRSRQRTPRLAGPPPAGSPGE